VESKDCFVDGRTTIPLLVSPLIPATFRHGFTTRMGGVSAPPYDGLNLGGKWGDLAENVAENRRRLLAASGAAAMFAVSQVHGIRVVRVAAGDAPDGFKGEQADGLCSDAVGLGLSVHTADCVPVLLADPRTGACAALHAGWRGAVAGMGPAGLRALVDGFGCRPDDVRVALGPCIAPCCFEVGPEVVAAAEAVWPGARDAGIVQQEGQGRPHVDLRCLLRLHL
jgi:polyphenol oxidase